MESPSKHKHDDYYALLEVDPKATQEEITQAHRALALQYHPDKNQGEDTTLMFTKISQVRLNGKHHQAFAVLSDPTNRALYDIVVGITPESAKERKRINAMKKRDAERDWALMDETVRSKIEEETARNGLLILEARYGELDQLGAAYDTKDVVRFIDVTVPLQCMVDGSALVIHNGTSKSWLRGFYEANEGGENQLYVLYKFLGHHHEVLVGETEELCIPLPEHKVESSELTASGERLQHTPRPRVNRLQAAEEERQTKRRRRFVLFSSVAVLLGWYFVRKEYIKLPAAFNSLVNFSPWSFMFGGPSSSSSSSSSSSGASGDKLALPAPPVSSSPSGPSSSSIVSVSK